MSLMRPLSEVQSQIERMFSDFAQGFGLEPLGASSAISRPGITWMPAIEMYDQDHELVVRAEVPGIKPDDLSVEVSPTAVTLSGVSEQRREQGGVNLYRSEFRYGRFQRRIPLPEDVNTEQARAEFKHGVLELHIPRPEEGKRKRLKVEVHEKG